MSDRRSRHVIVLGAGIVGTCCALELRQAGCEVTLVDRAAPSSGCSAGNAGVIASEAVLPLASPEMLLKVPSMLLSAQGPLSIRYRYLPQLLPWLGRFVSAAGSACRQSSAEALRDLLQTSLSDHQRLAQLAGCDELLRGGGWLRLYRKRQAFEAERGDFARQRDLGIRVDELDAAGIAERAPALADTLRYGVHFPDSGWSLDSRQYGERLAAAFRARGGRLLQAEIRALEPCGDGVCLRTHGGELRADSAVVALGAWSGKICNQLGERVPLDTERGYHVSLPKAQPGLSMPVMLAEHKVVATPMASGLRLAGTVEFAGVDAKPDYRRAQRLLQLGRELFPDLDERDASLWMGCRPSLPDSLPVLGASTRHAGIHYAFGHQHLGLTLAAVSARLICEQVVLGEASQSLQAYRVDRF